MPKSPHQDCRLCPRLAEFRAANRRAEPDWFNGPVPPFAANRARLLIVGLAPGLRGANRTGRPFTGDGAGELLYPMLHEFGFSAGSFDRRADDGLKLRDCAITNAVRCVPPQNRPTAFEIRTCQQFLAHEIAGMPELRVILALGRIAHESLLRTLGVRLAEFAFAHAARHQIPPYVVFDSYHCSRYNTNTGRLTEQSFRRVFRAIRTELS